MADEVENPIPEPQEAAAPVASPAAPEAAPEAPMAEVAAPVESSSEAAKPGVDTTKLIEHQQRNRGPRPDGGSALRPDGRRQERTPRADPAREGGRPEGGGNRGPGSGAGGGNRGPGGDRGPRPEGGPNRGPGGDRGPRRDDPRGGDRRGGPPEGIELEKLIADSLYLDNQAHNVVVRLGLMDSGTKSQLRRLYNAVRRATRAPETERQHEFVMLRARLAYTIARHSLRSLDTIERLLLQVTRKNDAKGYERFRDLFEAIVAYNE